MEKERSSEEARRRFPLIVLERPDAEGDECHVPRAEFAKTEAENKVLKKEVLRLQMELADARRQDGGLTGDILMKSVVDALLHQAKSLIVFKRDSEEHIRAH